MDIGMPCWMMPLWRKLQHTLDRLPRCPHLAHLLKGKMFAGGEGADSGSSSFGNTALRKHNSCFEQS
ncbi:hypothetical protein MRB53_016769 [Persea americana]|uniref:Uncharacterized protein n=1 Tax=Persea americana TaxID=3435 RepID=A0ACC2M342_PERAE|nr:hypothetical protein MRB53_016769 [Persea americana]